MNDTCIETNFRTKVQHARANTLRVLIDLASGLSLFRALFYQHLQTIRLKGRVLDIGGKNISSGYFARFRSSAMCEIVSTDLNNAPGVVQLDVERPFPIADDEFDFVLAFNLFEHVFFHTLAPSEVRRILRPNGRVIVCVPFLHEYHPDPNDYYRYTAPALERIWTTCGLRCESIHALGEGLLTFAFTKAARLIFPLPIYRAIAPVLYLIMLPIDRLIALRPRVDDLAVPARFPLGYIAVFTKA